MKFRTTASSGNYRKRRICVLTGRFRIRKKVAPFSSKITGSKESKEISCMNKYIRAVGLLSLGTASLVLQNQAKAAEGGDKPWQISAALKGFYDDNIYTAPTGSNRKFDSYGFEVNPSLKYAISTEASLLKFGYTYSAKYFEGRPSGDDKWDQSHLFNVLARHEFSPGVSLDLSDAFAIAQEPGQLAPAGSPLAGAPLRASGDNKANHGNISGAFELTPGLSAVVGYRNDYYNYDKPPAGQYDPGYQAKLNRIEHNPSLDLRYQLQPATVVLVGYRYSIVDYNSGLVIPGSSQLASIRNNTSHVVTAGVDQKFNESLSASLRAGAQIVSYDSSSGNDETTPYVDASLKYQFAPSSSAQLGVRHEHNATDVAIAGASVIEDQVSTSAYFAVAHAFTAKLQGKLTAQYQYSEFVGASAHEDIFSGGASLSYEVTSNISVEASYFYDKLTSEIQDRSFVRNRIFLGVRATY
jgi:Putative beta-barrel porin 2